MDFDLNATLRKEIKSANKQLYYFGMIQMLENSLEVLNTCSVVDYLATIKGETDEGWKKHRGVNVNIGDCNLSAVIPIMCNTILNITDGISNSAILEEKNIGPEFVNLFAKTECGDVVPSEFAGVYQYVDDIPRHILKNRAVVYVNYIGTETKHRFAPASYMAVNDKLIRVEDNSSILALMPNRIAEYTHNIIKELYSYIMEKNKKNTKESDVERQARSQFCAEDLVHISMELGQLFLDWKTFAGQSPADNIQENLQIAYNRLHVFMEKARAQNLKVNGVKLP
jgi:hypothetical protein